MLAVRPGQVEGPPTCAGSHLDTQPTGGRYDGILGVCAAIEMLRVLKEKSVETKYPVAAINWTKYVFWASRCLVDAYPSPAKRARGFLSAW